MKKLLFITTLFVLFGGCNENENKEARIRKLEAEIQQATNRTEFRGTFDMEGKLYTEPTAASMLPNGNILLGESWRQSLNSGAESSKCSKSGAHTDRPSGNVNTLAGDADSLSPATDPLPA